MADDTCPSHDIGNLPSTDTPIDVPDTALAPAAAAPATPDSSPADLPDAANRHPARAGAPSPIDPTVRLPPELWLEIFRYATHVPRARTIAPADPFAPERPANYAWGVNSPVQSVRTKCALVGVCRAWRALATELLYEHVVLSSARRVHLFCRTLYESRGEEWKRVATGRAGHDAWVKAAMGHGRWVRHLEVQRWARSHQWTQYWQCLMRSLTFCPKLRVFSGLWQTPLPQGVLAALEQYLPSTLQELYWQQDSVLIAAKELPVLTTSFISKFSALRVLDLRKICVLDAERSLQDVTFATLTLPRVAYLALPTCPLMLRFASKQGLPALQYLILDAAGAPRTVWAHWVSKELTTFLDTHGHKLTTVELLPPITQSFRPGPVGISAFLSPKACPNLDTLVFDCREKAICPSPAALARLSDREAREGVERVMITQGLLGNGVAAPPLEEPHPRLRRVGIRGMGMSRLCPNKPTQAQAHLRAFAGCHAFFPALEVVRTLGFMVASLTDPCAPDVFIWWTERFEKVGVDLQDGEGVVWMLEEEEKKAQGSEKVGQRSDGRPGEGEGEGNTAGEMVSASADAKDLSTSDMVQT
ncbi:hypothetical protein PYCCODRAFT_1403917 [Trametes coccinea BRFM310]|uniref:Uncharacterized protein n=1 Tax=Trametes coccinea (strain BRFM310) TaxID=1353009 RepID=A0A1Y2J138_TRAC3|nr:hypothetical protein PYCCODRAFT_1403917 [Trametes coccinea BRFM310]